MSGRNFRRLIVRYDEEGEAGLRDRRFGRPSPRRAVYGKHSPDYLRRAAGALSRRSRVWLT